MKGGVGKSTTCFNTAAVLAGQGKKILLIDADLQGNSTLACMQKEQPQRTLEDVMSSSPAPIDQVAAKTTTKNLWIVPSIFNIDLDALMSERGLYPYCTHNRLKYSLDRSSREYDYCLIDCAPSVSALTVNAMYASNLIVVPVKPDLFAFTGMQSLCEILSSMRRTYFPMHADFKILFNMVHRVNGEKVIIEAICNQVGDEHIFRTRIRVQPAQVVNATNSGNFVALGKSKIADDFRAFADELRKEEFANGQEEERRAGSAKRSKQ
jgi:chromosome partitioning protein